MESDVRGDAQNARTDTVPGGAKVAHDAPVDSLSPSTTEYSHEELIRALCIEFPQAQRRNFGRLFRERWPEEEYKVTIIPDAFIVDEANKMIVAYEVEVSHRIPPDKMAVYADIGWFLDWVDWTLGLIRIDRYGVGRAYQPQADDLGHIIAVAQKKRVAAGLPPTDPNWAEKWFSAPPHSSGMVGEL